MTKERSQDSEQRVLALFSLLSHVADKPSCHDQYAGLKDALGRQSKLARLELPACGVHSVGALNTLKRVADKVLVDHGGFAQLDAMRRALRSEIERLDAEPHAPQRETRDQLRRQLSLAKARNTTLREDLAFVSERFIAAINLAQRCASAADELTQATFKRQKLELLQSMGLRRISSTGRQGGDHDDSED